MQIAFFPSLWQVIDLLKRAKNKKWTFLLTWDTGKEGFERVQHTFLSKEDHTWELLSEIELPYPKSTQQAYIPINLAEESMN